MPSDTVVRWVRTNLNNTVNHEIFTKKNNLNDFISFNFSELEDFLMIFSRVLFSRFKASSQKLRKFQRLHYSIFQNLDSFLNLTLVLVWPQCCRLCFYW
jgi:hypothetical protein